jgi:hypothetical protein
MSDFSFELSLVLETGLFLSDVPHDGYFVESHLGQVLNHWRVIC